MALPQYSPTIPAGTDIFREIGYGGPAPQPKPQVAGLDQISQLIAKGDVPSLMKVKELIDGHIQQKVASVTTPRQQPVGLPPAVKPAPTPAQAPTPQPSAPQAAPAAPAPAASGNTSSMLADLTKLVKAVGALSGGAGSPADPTASTASAPPPPNPATQNNPLLSTAVQPMAGRPTM